MKLRKLTAAGIWLGVGLVVIGATLRDGQRAAVWGKTGGPLGEIDDHFHPRLLDGEWEMAEKLPESEVLPGEVSYTAKVAHDWLWWRLAGSPTEKARRLLYLANERLRAGWELCRKGKTGLALETLMKAEGYLTEAIKSNDVTRDGKWGKELLDSAQLHYELLSDLEKTMPEEARPRVTELLNVPKLMAVR